MKNASTEISLSAHPSLATRDIYHKTVAPFTKEILDADEPILVGNIQLLHFTGGPTNKRRTGNIWGDWGPDRSVAVVTAVGVPVEELLSDIVMNARIAVINLECDCEEAWIKPLEEGWQTQSVDQWME